MNGSFPMVTLAVLALASSLHAQGPPAPVLPPRLVVVLVVDQLRADYMDRFRPFFGRSGFNLFLERGARYPQARHQHGTTSTCPGHAVILTGSYGNVNGIIANYWFDRRTAHETYCAADPTVRLVRSEAEGRSPRNLKGATVGDLLKVATGGAGRVLAVSAKDRSAIMLGGHLADGVYWMVDTLFVTSTYYRPDLPRWAEEFNRSGAVSSVRGKRWERLLPPSAYALVGPDDVEAEADEDGMGRTFPHPIGAGPSDRSFVEAFDQSPYSNEVVADFAMRAVSAEGLGRDSVPDLLAVSFSANDRVGHLFGPDSHEVMDVTVRLDRTLARFFGFLDRTVGLANTVVVLTADHGVAPMPEVLQRLHPGATARRIHPRVITEAATRALEARYGAARGPGWLAYDHFPHLSLDLRVLREKKLPVEEAERVVADALAEVPGVHEAFTATELERQRAEGVRSAAVYSFYPGRSGNIYYQLEPYLMIGAGAGWADHGSRWAYDQQVPVLWYGPGIKPGVYQAPAAVADIAPTLSAVLGLARPGGSEGRVLGEMLR